MKDNKPHKRYLVFGYWGYYPTGGMDDMVKDCDTKEEAEEVFNKHAGDYKTIYDRVDGKIIKEYEK